MILLKKKLTGIGFVLLGGLAVAHGGSAGYVWEVASGVVFVALGILLLAAKVLRRNIAHDVEVPK